MCSWGISDVFSVCFLLVSGSDFGLHRPVPSGCGCSLSRSWTWERRGSLQQGRLEDLSGTTLRGQRQTSILHIQLRPLSMKFYAAFMYVDFAYVYLYVVYFWYALAAWSQTWGEVGTGSWMGCCVTMAFESHCRKLRKKGHGRLFELEKNNIGKIRYVFCPIASYSCCQVPALEMCLQFLHCKGQQFSSHRNEVWLPGHGRISDDFRASQCDRHRFNKWCFDPLCRSAVIFGRSTWPKRTCAAGELVVTDRVAAAQEPTFQYREGPARLEGDVHDSEE